MTGSNINPIPNPGSWQAPEQLLALDQPAHEVLADFIHGCSPDPATRTVATTALVLSLWQLRGHAFTPEVPSLLLLHAGESADDPIDKLVRDLVYDAAENKPRVQKKGAFMNVSVDRAPTAMKNAFIKRQALVGIVRPMVPTDTTRRRMRKINSTQPGLPLMATVAADLTQRHGIKNTASSLTRTTRSSCG